MRYALCNGSLIPHGEALIPIEKKEVLFSFGVYESLKVREGVPLFLDEHLQRFFESARIMELSHPFDAEGISRGLYDLIEQNGVREATVRIQMYGGEDPFYYAFVSKLPRYPGWYYREGIETVSYRGERFLPRAKSNCLLLNYMAQRAAERAGAAEALLIDHDGNALEGSRSNLFALSEGKLLTPGENVLHGVTRSHIIESCRNLPLRIEYRPPKVRDIFEGRYDGIFISSTSMGAVPVRGLDGKQLSSDPARRRALLEITEALNWHLREMERMDIEKKSGRR
jgi:branched-subunit amino acid aminotransferase/4-amino-4-deoxychorismate lyase